MSIYPAFTSASSECSPTRASRNAASTAASQPGQPGLVYSSTYNQSTQFFPPFKTLKKQQRQPLLHINTTANHQHQQQSSSQPQQQSRAFKPKPKKHLGKENMLPAVEQRKTTQQQTASPADKAAASSQISVIVLSESQEESVAEAEANQQDVAEQNQQREPPGNENGESEHKTIAENNETSDRGKPAVIQLPTLLAEYEALESRYVHDRSALFSALHAICSEQQRSIAQLDRQKSQLIQRCQQLEQDKQVLWDQLQQHKKQEEQEGEKIQQELPQQQQQQQQQQHDAPATTSDLSLDNDDDHPPHLSPDTPTQTTTRSRVADGASIPQASTQMMIKRTHSGRPLPTADVDDDVVITNVNLAPDVISTIPNHNHNHASRTRTGITSSSSSSAPHKKQRISIHDHQHANTQLHPRLSMPSGAAASSSSSSAAPTPSPFVETVRNRELRASFPAYACDGCTEFHNMMNHAGEGTEEEVMLTHSCTTTATTRAALAGATTTTTQQPMAFEEAGRHRFQFPPRCTPPDYWDVASPAEAINMESSTAEH